MDVVKQVKCYLCMCDHSARRGCKKTRRIAPTHMHEAWGKIMLDLHRDWALDLDGKRRLLLELGDRLTSYPQPTPNAMFPRLPNGCLLSTVSIWLQTHCGIRTSDLPPIRRWSVPSPSSSQVLNGTMSYTDKSIPHAPVPGP